MFEAFMANEYNEVFSSNTGLQKKKKKNIYIYIYIFFFSVTSTKVGELNSIFYAEFTFVLSFSLSLKGFK
jgi:hypothetical protein